MDCLGSPVPRQKGGALPKEVAEVVRSNRLEGLVYASSDYTVPEGWQSTYQQRQLHGLKLLKVTEQFASKLEASGVFCITLRGAVDALDLYGDVAARSYSDIDLYVPRSQVDLAWRCAKEYGFSLYHSDMPKGYYVRNHLNWALVHEDFDVMCDLHWAVDHPFQNVRIDYEGVFKRSSFCEVDGRSIRMPSKEDWLLLSAQHFLKHVPELSSVVNQEAWLSALSKRYVLKYLMDLAFFFKRDGATLNWRLVQERAKQWEVGEAFYSSLHAASLLSEEPIPDELVARAKQFTASIKNECAVPKRSIAVRLLNRFSRNQGFSFDRLNTLVNYCWIPRDASVSLLMRVRHLFFALPRLLFAGVDTALCVLVSRIRKTSSSHAQQPVEVQHG